MSYDYKKERESLFTEDGQVMFLKIRDSIEAKLKIAGACRSQEAMAGALGSSWQMMACIDRMVELGELVEVTDNTRAWGQHRVFVSGKGSA